MLLFQSAGRFLTRRLLKKAGENFYLGKNLAGGVAR